MTCKQVERTLTENISAVEKADVQAHIRSCRRCDKLCRELQSMEKLSRLLGETVGSPSDFSSRVHRRLSEDPVSWWQAYWRPVFVFALVTLFSLGFIWVREVQVTDEVMSSSSVVQEESVSGNEVPTPYVDVIVNSPSQSEYILRLPSRIRIQTTHLNHDFYLEHASY